MVINVSFDIHEQVLVKQKYNGRVTHVSFLDYLEIQVYGSVVTLETGMKLFVS